MIDYVTLWILIVLCASYIVLHAVLWSGLNRRTAPNYSGPEHRFSVIIAARNEETTIGPLLRSLALLEYPRDRFEVIIVNDRSTDSTGPVISSFQQLPNLSMIEIKENISDMPNKKNALRTAIDRAQFEILVFTDADCIVPPRWLHQLNENFTDDVGIVAGYSPYHAETSGAFLRYEELKNSVIAASAVGAGIPFLCTGRNFAYRKHVYLQVGGFEKIKHSVSGDDDLFLQLAARETNWKVRYMTSPDGAVPTQAPASVSQFIHQRTRHVSASTSYPRIVQMGYALVQLFHLSILIGAFFQPLTALIVLMVKFNVDGAMIAKGLELFKEKLTVAEFFTEELLLIVYAQLIAPLGFVRSFTWKGSPSI
jgi:cellulose synthase/poly-beta-1,6-N-acetylglucosamine synthase-like glycosyltransferase